MKTRILGINNVVQKLGLCVIHKRWTQLMSVSCYLCYVHLIPSLITEMYQLRDTNSMVEEFMLLANISVAKKIHEAFPNYALLRFVHLNNRNARVQHVT